ncbi:hypothetical protein NUW58_g9216 [Xylaria curta]|uniref:Uncharacterized protein n=1 Tax=Xylaria curta TaxID=42375 RepID=A0ACC1N1G1_9PEZI|nr:hypothetical protein NUW58_g9216 [Xylaria curta]
MLSYAYYRHRADERLPLTSTLDNQAWFVTGTEKAEYIEAFNFQLDGSNDLGDDGASSCRYGSLVGHEVLDWATRSGHYAPPESRDTGNALRGGIRLLFLERLYYQPPSFHIKKDTYLAIEREFSLPENTLLALSNNSGLSTHAFDVDKQTGRLKRLGMIVKASQKFQVGNYGLAFSYDFATGLSTGIVHGTGVTQHGNDYKLWSTHAAAEIFEHIKAGRHFWNHPLCLPTTLLQHHILRTEYFCTIVLSNKFTDMQHQLGTVRAGRLFGQRAQNIALEMPVQQAKGSLREMTVSMSSLMFDTIYFGTVSDWQCSCSKLLLELLTEIESLNRGERRVSLIMGSKIRFLASSAESMKRHNNGMKENGQADMDILYSIISQVDNRLSSKMAAASSRDSAAMKTLAFLTAIFLPGTFVATIFSTDFFDWNNDSGMIVSEMFWVYAALAAPLTIVVAVGWRLWWSWEKKQFDDDINAEIKAITGDFPYAF